MKQKYFKVGLKSVDTVAKNIIEMFPKGAVIGLSGELGSGKTTLVRSVIHLLSQSQGIKIGRIVSPSFVLHQSYEQLKPAVHHFDLYRMNQVTEKTKNESGFMFVEWPEMCTDLSVLRLDSQIEITILDSVRQYCVQTK